MSHNGFLGRALAAAIAGALLAGCATSPSGADETSDQEDEYMESSEGLTVPGISRALARDRARRFADLHYRLEVDLTGRSSFTGRVGVSFDVVDPPAELVLDFKGRAVDSVAVDGRPVTWRRENDHLVIPGDALRLGRRHVTVAYEGGIGAAGEGIIEVEDADDPGARYLYTLNVPADGHALMPCFDQPDLKARFTLSVHTPEDWLVIANAPRAAAETGGGRRTHRFRPTPPLPTYLFAFAAGPFTKLADDDGERRLRFFGRRSQRALLERHAGEIFARHRASLRFLEDYFGIPYPFDKLDFVCVPDFPFSGMEHAGCIFYGEDPLLFRQEVTRLQEARRADLIAHETAHMWFGDLVTMPWFDDVWLKEGFATFMAHKTLEATFSGIDHARNFYLRNVPSALDTDTTSGARPIRLPLDNLADAKSAYGPIIYRKGPAVLRQLEFLIGEDAFARGARLFLERHAFGCGDWTSLQGAMEQAWGEGRAGGLDGWSEAWIEGAGAPRVTARIDAGGVALVQQSLDGSSRRWPLAVSVLVREPGGVEHRFDVRTEDEVCPVPQAPAGAAFAFANDGARAYGLFELDDVSRAFVLRSFREIGDPLLRATLWESLWAEVQAARLEPRSYVGFALEHLGREDDLRLVTTILGHVATCLSRYLDGPARLEPAGAVEKWLRRTMTDEACDKGLRLTAFRALFRTVHTPDGRDLLDDLIAGRRTLPGIEIALRDRWSMLTRLMLLGDPRADAWLASLRAEDSGDEGRRRAFLAECARPDAASKQRLFARFRNDADLPERWVQNAAPVFFAAEHAALTSGFLADALAQLAWIKENRKIFFLAAWVDACVRGQVSAADLATVDRYVADPATPPDVRLKTLVARDHLGRTVRIRQQAAGR